jgi:hypothetical protein
MHFERITEDWRRAMTRWTACLTVAAAALSWAGSASADFTFSLTTGSSFNSGSGVAFSTNAGLYSARDLYVTTDPSEVPGVFDIEIADINPMPTVRPPLEPTTFHFALASNPRLTFDTVAGTINGSLTDAPVTIIVSRKNGGSTIDSDSYPISFTTGSVPLPPCGGAPARSVNGSLVDNDPNDGFIDEVILVAAVCMVDFGGSVGFDTPIEIRLRGTLTALCPDVDDGVPCTVDSCDFNTFDVTNIPDHVSCRDDDLCNGAEFCDPILDCQPGAPLIADDGIACTSDSCDPLLGVLNAPQHSLCSDGDLCTGIEFCSVTLGCRDGTPPVIDDGIACTIDSCSALAGVANIPDDLACDDADVCTGFEFCSPIVGCLVGTPLVADDGVACTIDICDPVAGVANVPDDSTCSDSNVCTGTEFCDATLGCQAGTPLAVDDGIACTLDGCDPVHGAVNEPNHDACNDGSLCNGDEICDVALGCLEGEAPPALVWEDFESLAIQNDVTGVFVPELDAIFYRVNDDAGTVGSVIVADEGGAAISESYLGGRVWKIESTSEGPFVADVSIPPDPEAEFSESGVLGTFFSEPVDLRSTVMCVDVREVFQQRISDIRFVIGDVDGNIGLSEAIGPLPITFETIEHSFGTHALAPAEGAPLVDLRRVTTLGFDFWTTEGAAGPFEFEIDDLRLVPEPASGSLTLCALGTPLALRAARGRARRRSWPPKGLESARHPRWRSQAGARGWGRGSKLDQRPPTGLEELEFKNPRSGARIESAKREHGAESKRPPRWDGD